MTERWKGNLNTGEVKFLVWPIFCWKWQRDSKPILSSTTRGRREGSDVSTRWTNISKQYQTAPMKEQVMAGGRNHHETLQGAAAPWLRTIRHQHGTTTTSDHMAATSHSYERRTVKEGLKSRRGRGNLSKFWRVPTCSNIEIWWEWLDGKSSWTWAGSSLNKAGCRQATQGKDQVSSQSTKTTLDTSGWITSCDPDPDLSYCSFNKAMKSQYTDDVHQQMI